MIDSPAPKAAYWMYPKVQIFLKSQNFSKIHFWFKWADLKVFYHFVTLSPQVMRINPVSKKSSKFNFFLVFDQCDIFWTVQTLKNWHILKAPPANPRT